MNNLYYFKSLSPRIFPNRIGEYECMNLPLFWYDQDLTKLTEYDFSFFSGVGLHQQRNVNEALQAFLIGLIHKGVIPKVTQIVDKTHQLFPLVQIFRNEVFLLVYLYIIPNKKVTFRLVHGKQLGASLIYSIPNDASCSMSFGADGVTRNNRLEK